MPDIPVVNYKTLSTASELKALDDACREPGVFYLANHGIDTDLLASLKSCMAEFFSLPIEEKNRIRRSKSNPWGYYDSELTKQTRDWKEILDIGPDNVTGPFRDTRTQWPDHNAAFKAVAQDYYSQCESVSLALLDALAQNLGIDPGQLRNAFLPEHTSYLRLNHYPRCPNPEAPVGLSLPETGSLGVNFHSDAGVLTVLYMSGEPGLEIYREGTWQLVQHAPGCLLINLSDMLQVWSNDRYQAPIHRVLVYPDRDRYSAPFFLNPGYHADIRPLSIMDGDTAHYRSLNWGDYRYQRAEGDFASYGEEIQISRYRL